MTDIYSAALLAILPESLKKDPQFVAMAEALTPELQAISKAIVEVVLHPRIDELPEPVVDLLAWEYHVDFYDPALPMEKKRALVKNSRQWHERKGTPSAVEEVVTIAFDVAQVVEWFEYGGEPYHFKITTRDRITSEERFKEMLRAVDSAKRKSTRLQVVNIIRDNDSAMFIGGKVTRMKCVTINPEVI